MSDSSEASLYERLGGYDVIAAVTDEFLDRLMNDPKIGYTGLATASIQSGGTGN